MISYFQQQQGTSSNNSLSALNSSIYTWPYLSQMWYNLDKFGLKMSVISSALSDYNDGKYAQFNLNLYHFLKNPQLFSLHTDF